MTNHDCIENLAGLLEVERQEAELLLNQFSSAIVAELLAERKLSIKGLGAFTVTHFPATKKSTTLTVVYSPPSNRLTFSSQISGVDDTIRLAMSRLSMSLHDAERFGKSLVDLFSSAVQQQREVCLNGIGRFAFEQGVYGFFPEQSLEELLNREYQGLREVVLSPPQVRLDKEEEKKFRYVVPLAVGAIVVGAIAVLLLAVFYGMQPKAVSSGSTKPQPARMTRAVVQSERPAAVVHNDHEMEKRPSVPVLSVEKEGANDALVLAPKNYTIVLVTFSNEESARKEVKRLRSEGVVAFIWPAYQNGINYYRVISGGFSSRSAATERIGQMAQKTDGAAYIQQVQKGVVLHGTKGL